MWRKQTTRESIWIITQNKTKYLAFSIVSSMIHAIKKYLCNVYKMHVHTHSRGHNIPYVIMMLKRKIKVIHCKLDKIKIIKTLLILVLAGSSLGSPVILYKIDKHFFQLNSRVILKNQ